jgi:hypothetical protein
MGTGPGDGHIRLPCPGKDVNTGLWWVGEVPKIYFHTDGRCKFSQPDGVTFDPPNQHPKGLSNPTVADGGTTISYDYDYKRYPIPEAGYGFKYNNDDTRDGNGSGVVKPH